MRIYFIVFCIAVTAGNEYQKQDSEESNNQEPIKRKHEHRFNDNPMREKVRDEALNFTLGNRLEEQVEKGFHQRKIFRRRCHGTSLKCKKIYILPSSSTPLVTSTFLPTQPGQINSTSQLISTTKVTLKKDEQIVDEFSTTAPSTIKTEQESAVSMVPATLHERNKNANSILQSNAVEVPISLDKLILRTLMVTTPNSGGVTPMPVIMKIPFETKIGQSVSESQINQLKTSMTSAATLNSKNQEDVKITGNTAAAKTKMNSVEKVNSLATAKPFQTALQSLHKYPLETEIPSKKLGQETKLPSNVEISSARMRTSRSTPSPVTQKPFTSTKKTTFKPTTSMKMLLNKQESIRSVDKALTTTAPPVSIATTKRSQALNIKNPKSIITTSKFTTRSPKFNTTAKKAVKSKHKSVRPTARTSIRTPKLTTTKTSALRNTTAAPVTKTSSPVALITKSHKNYITTPELTATTYKPDQTSTNTATTTAKSFEIKKSTATKTKAIPSTDLVTTTTRTTFEPSLELNDAGNPTTLTSKVQPTIVPSTNQPAKTMSTSESTTTILSTKPSPILSNTESMPQASTTKPTEVEQDINPTKPALSTMFITKSQSADPTVTVTTTFKPLITTPHLTWTAEMGVSTLNLGSSDVFTIFTEGQQTAKTLPQETTLITTIPPSVSTMTNHTNKSTSKAPGSTTNKKIYTLKKQGSETAMKPEIQTTTMKFLPNSSDPSRNTIIPDIKTEVKSKPKKKTKKKKKGFSNDGILDFGIHFDIASTPKQTASTSTTTMTTSTTMATSTTTRRRKKLNKKRKGFSNNGNTDLDNMWG